jgi:hypothetical protein
MQNPAPPDQSGSQPAGKAVLKAGTICFVVAAISMIAQPVFLVFVHGPMMSVCAVLAIIAIAKDQVRRGVQLLLATFFILPIIWACSMFFWFVGIGVLFGSLGATASPSISAIHSPTPVVFSSPTRVGHASLKDKFLDQIRTQESVSIADFRTDHEIEIELQPEASFDSAKAKNAALAIAKEWQKLSGQSNISVSIWQGARLLAKESLP